MKTNFSYLPIFCIILCLLLPLTYTWACDSSEDCPTDYSCIGQQICSDTTCYELDKECVLTAELNIYIIEQSQISNILLTAAEEEALAAKAYESGSIFTPTSTNKPAFTVASKLGSDASIEFLQGESTFTLGITGTQSHFQISQDRIPILIIDRYRNIGIESPILTVGNLRVEGDLVYGNTKQFQIEYEEVFLDEVGEEWSFKEKSICGGVFMLGGYELLSEEEIGLEIKGLRKHAEVRVEANFHFIDAWHGESGYMMIDGEYVWTESNDYTLAKAAINVCGGLYGESKFQSTIDVVVPHTSEDLDVTFGSTLVSAPSLASYGISSFRISLR